jgi:hypothetical protein
MSQTTLALVIALITVSATFITGIFPWFQPLHSDLRVVYAHAGYDELTLLVRNDGRSAGVLRTDGLDVDGILYPTSFESFFIEPGKERSIPIKINFTDRTCRIVKEILNRRPPEPKNLQLYFERRRASRQSNDCHFQIIQNSFGYQKVDFVPIPCEDILYARRCERSDVVPPGEEKEDSP